MKIVALVFVSVGLLLMGIGIWSGVATRSFVSTAESTQGVAIDRLESSSYYYAVVEFRTPDGEVFRFRSSTGSSPPAFQLGEEVGVFYQKENPRQAKIDSFGELWLSSTLFTGIGAVFALLGTGVFHVKG